MIADAVFSHVIRLAAPWVWRSNARIAQKLLRFSATESGSALDMLRAAELTTDPQLRRLFFHHALDEARHARMFRNAARSLMPEGTPQDEYAQVHGTRQDLLERYGLVGFIAFVHVAERAGMQQFEALREHFRHQPDLHALFSTVAHEEKFHVSYSGRQLQRWRAQGRGKEVRNALIRIQAQRAWEAWRRAGRVLGDVMSRAIISVICLVVIPGFALLQRLSPRKSGWQKPAATDTSLAAARREF